MSDATCRSLRCTNRLNYGVSHDLDDLALDKALTLIGDELADRGQNDYFTLLVLGKLREGNVPTEVLLSNHGMDFMSRFLGGGRQSISASQAVSLTNMNSLIERRLISREEVDKLVSKAYKPMVKAFSYSISPEGQLTIYSHAPVGLETIVALAKKYNITYQGESIAKLTETIDQINLAVQDRFGSKLVQDFFEELDACHVDATQGPIRSDYPLCRLLWNRTAGAELGVRAPFGSVQFVHGHVGVLRSPISKAHTNLDNYFGKGGGDFETGRGEVEHFTHVSSDVSAALLERVPAAEREKFSSKEPNEQQKRLDELGDKARLATRVKHLISSISTECGAQAFPAFEALKRKADPFLAEDGLDTVEESALRELRDKAIVLQRFVRLLAPLRDKITEFGRKKGEKYRKAEMAAQTLNKTLFTQFPTELTADKIGDYETECKKALQTAKPILATHRNSFTRFLDGLLFAISSLLSLGIANAVSYGTTGSVFFSPIKTHSAQVMSDIEGGVDAIRAPNRRGGQEGG